MVYIYGVIAAGIGCLVVIVILVIWNRMTNRQQVATPTPMPPEPPQDTGPSAAEFLRNFFRVDPMKLLIPAKVQPYRAWRILRDARHGEFLQREAHIEYRQVEGVSAETFIKDVFDVELFDFEKGGAASASGRLLGWTFARCRGFSGGLMSTSNIVDIQAGKYDDNLEILMRFIPRAVQQETELPS